MRKFCIALQLCIQTFFYIFIGYNFCMDAIFKCHVLPFSFSDCMKKKSTIVALPVVPFNQSKLSDVCQYLDYLQNCLSYLPLPEVLILL